MSQFPNGEGQGGSRADQLKDSGDQEQARPTAHEEVKGSSVSCTSGRRSSEPTSPTTLPSEPPGETDDKPPPIKPHYYHVGIDFGVRQYGIGTRGMLLKVPMYAPPLKSASPVQKAAASSIPLKAEEAARGPRNMAPPDSLIGAPQPFLVSLTSGANRLKVEPTVHGYALDGTPNASLNKMLGIGIAVHLQRTGIIKPKGNGNFTGSMLGSPEKGLESTEMMGLNLAAYLRAKVDGAMVIREIVQGKIGEVISQSVYDSRKLAQPNVYSSAQCGSMPLIPGIYQVHVLLEDTTTDREGAGGVSVVEVHCDGDPLYP